MSENEDFFNIPMLEQMELKEDENSIDLKDFKRIKDVDVNIPYIPNFTSTKNSFEINGHNYLENLKNKIKEKEKKEEEELFSSNSNEEENIKKKLIPKNIGKKRFRTNFKKISKKKYTTSEKMKCTLKK